MTPKEVIQNALSDRLTKVAGAKVTLKLGDGLTLRELKEFERRMPGTIPDEIRDLLNFTSGIEIDSFGVIDFLGRNPFECEDLIPYGVPILGDGDGDFWVIDIRQDTGIWGAVFFVCHDPSVIIIQAPMLTIFLEQIVQSFKPPHTNLLSYVKDEVVYKIDDAYPHFIDLEEARRSPDPIISTFAKELPDTFKVIDLRSAEVGSGFNYLVSGIETKVKRCRAELIFARARLAGCNGG